MLTEEVKKKMKERYKEASMKSIYMVARLVKGLYTRTEEYLRLSVITNENLQLLKDYMDDFKISSRDSYLGYLNILYDLYEEPVPSKLKIYILETRKAVKLHHQTKTHDILNDLDLNKVEHVLNKKKDKNDSLSNNQKWLLMRIIKDHPLRLGELSDTLWEDDGDRNWIDLTDNRIVIRKHKSERSVGPKYFNISESLKKDLEYFKSKYNNIYVFIKNRYPYDEPASQTIMGSLWTASIKTYYKEIGEDYKPHGIHDVRHQYATKACKSINIDPKVIAELNKIKDELGHKNLATTLTHYLKTMEES